MNDFGQALQTASPFLLGLGAQLQGRDPNGISSGLAQMQEEAEKARRKSAIADLMGQMGIGGSKAALLDMLPFEAQAQMLMQEQQRMEGAAELDSLYGALYGGYSDGGGASGGYGQPTGGTTTQEVMGSRASAPNMGGIASGPLNPTPSQPNYVAPEDIGNIAPEHAAAKAALVAGGEPGSAVSYAARMLNKGEVPNRAELQKYMETGGAGMDPKTAAWCAAFVNASLGHAGIQGTGKMNARSFLEWGQPVDKPEPGDIAVFSRGDPNGWQGHVGFFQGYDESGNIKVLGGNQGDAVTVQAYPKDRLLGFRRAGESAPKKQDDNVTRRALLQGMRSNDPGVRAFAQMEYEKRFGQPEFDASRYKVVGDTLVDLMAPGGPAAAFQGKSSPLVQFGGGAGGAPIPPQSAVPEGVDVSGALGSEGLISGMANTVADMFGADLPAPQNEQAIQVLNNLRVRTMTTLQQAIPGRPSNYLMQQLEKLAVEPQSLLMGEGRARERLQQTQDMIRQELGRMEALLQNPAGLSNSEISNMVNGYTQLKALNEDYQRVLDGMGRGQNDAAPDVPPPPANLPQEILDLWPHFTPEERALWN